MLMTIIAFILILGLLVFVHELGHFIVARKSGMKVDEFGFGFPPRIFGIKKKGTLYSVNWIPLGGFVKIKGEDGSQRVETDSFGYQPFWKKGLVLSAGVIMNVILAFVLLSVGFMSGMPTVLDSQEDRENLKGQTQVLITGVAENSPASTVGLRLGDQILAMNGQELRATEDVQAFIREHQNEEINLTIQKREGDQAELKVSPAVIEGSADKKVLGVSLADTGLVKYGFFESLWKGLINTFNLLLAIIIAFFTLIKNLIFGQGVSADLAGPVGVAAMTGQMMDLGFGYLLRFTALLSLNLAVLNFFPFPALDGGRFIGVLIEKIRRKPNNQQVENLIHNTGFALLMLLVIFVTYRDVVKYGGEALEKIKNIF